MVPFLQPKPTASEKGSPEKSSVMLASKKAPPKPPRLRVGSSKAALSPTSPSHQALVDNQVLPEEDI